MKATVATLMLVIAASFWLLSPTGEAARSITSPAGLQEKQNMNGVWKLSVSGNTKTYRLSFSGESFTGTVTSDPKSPKSTLTGQIRTGRGKTFISWVEQEGTEQHTDKGLYTAAYAGVVEWQMVTGTLYDEDGSKQFKLTR